MRGNTPREYPKTRQKCPDSLQKCVKIPSTLSEILSQICENIKNIVNKCKICRGTLEFISKESRNSVFWAYLWCIVSEIRAFLEKFAEDPSSLFRKNHGNLRVGRIYDAF